MDGEQLATLLVDQWLEHEIHNCQVENIRTGKRYWVHVDQANALRDEKSEGYFYGYAVNPHPRDRHKGLRWMYPKNVKLVEE